MSGPSDSRGIARGLRHGTIAGMAAGLAGTTALNAVTYLDMALRGRSSSSAPQDVVEKLADKIGVPIPGDADTRTNRLQGLGPLSGLVAGVGTGALLGLLRGVGLRPPSVVTALIAGLTAMAGADGPIAALGISDPRTWTAQDWAADVVPHLVYGTVTARVLDALHH